MVKITFQSKHIGHWVACRIEMPNLSRAAIWVAVAQEQMHIKNIVLEA